MPLARIAALPGMNLAGHAAEEPNPAFCRVAAMLRPTADSNIRVEVWLPLSGWSFGWGGSLMSGGMLTGIAEGYAAASTTPGTMPRSWRARAGALRSAIRSSSSTTPTAPNT